MTPTVIPIAAIRRLTIHDGPGVRDTVFVKGCPLHCAWCHNPECLSPQRQLLFHATLCTQCGACVQSCPNGVHRFDSSGNHCLNRDPCQLCGKCVQACMFNALEICGDEMSVEEVIAKVETDADFFQPEGGVTLSGGEPALYPAFASEMFRKLQQDGLHTALDTCGAVPFEAYQRILPYTDLVLFDLKGMNPNRHRTHTGQDNRLIHENLRNISAFGTTVEIRMPIVPGYNDFPEDIAKTGVLLAQIATLVRVRLLPYHSLAGNKYAAAGLPNTLPQAETPTSERLARVADALTNYLPHGIPVLFR